MRYLIDAYNLLFCALKKTGNLQGNREALIQELNEEFFHIKLDAILVFDGAHTHFSQAVRGHFDAVEIVYTSERQSADEYILEEISFSKHPQTLTIVTNDRELRAKAHALYAHTLSIDQFLRLIKKKKHKAARRRWSADTLPKDSPKEIDRLLKIFEKKFFEDSSD